MIQNQRRHLRMIFLINFRKFFCNTGTETGTLLEGIKMLLKKSIKNIEDRAISVRFLNKFNKKKCIERNVRFV